MYAIGFGIAIAVIVIIIAIGIGAALLSVYLALTAVTFSRLTFGLVVALCVSRSAVVLSGSSFGNFLFWAIVVLGIMFLLSKLPRVNFAIRFFCTLLVSYLAMEVVGGLLIGVTMAIFGKEFAPGIGYELVMKGLSILIAAGALFLEIQRSPENGNIQITNPLLRLGQRLLASFIYGLACVVVLASASHGLWAVSAAVEWIILIGSTVLAYFADITVMDHLVDDGI